MQKAPFSIIQIPAKSAKRDLKHSGAFFKQFACDLGFAAYEMFCPKGPCGTTFWIHTYTHIQTHNMEQREQFK